MQNARPGVGTRSGKHAGPHPVLRSLKGRRPNGNAGGPRRGRLEGHARGRHHAIVVRSRRAGARDAASQRGEVEVEALEFPREPEAEQRGARLGHRVLALLAQPGAERPRRVRVVEARAQRPRGSGARARPESRPVARHAPAAPIRKLESPNDSPAPARVSRTSVWLVIAAGGFNGSAAVVPRVKALSSSRSTGWAP